MKLKRFKDINETTTGDPSVEEIDTIYAKEADITFIMKHVKQGGEDVSTEVVGFYYGEPDVESTKQYTGKLQAKF